MRSLDLDRRSSARLLVAGALLSTTIALASDGAATGGVRWAPYDEAAVSAALDDGKLVLLRLGTTWCHWCHVMDDETWANPGLADVVHARFAPFSADADRFPALHARYEPWGWPATIVLTNGGETVLAVRGFRTVDEMRALLAPIVDAHASGRPLPRVSLAVAAPAPLDGDLSRARDTVRGLLDPIYDEKSVGWGGPKKSVLAPVVVHALVRGAREGDAMWTSRALATLEKTTLLADPVWGGVYQYSTHNGWTKPHTEKLALSQAQAIRMFVEGHRASGKPAFLDVAKGVHRYLRAFLRAPSGPHAGAFFANQDADPPKATAKGTLGPAYYAKGDVERRALGVPFVDESVYASHNGVLIAALASLAGVTNDRAIGDDARAAYASVMKTHRDARGLLKHAASDAEGPRALVDQVAMIEAALALLELTGERAFRDDARALAKGTREHFATEAGFAVTEPTSASALAPFVPFDENVRLARALLHLSFLDGESEAPALRAEAERIARAFGTKPVLVREGRGTGDYALLVDELLHEPVHIAVVGKASPSRDALAAIARAANAPGRVVEVLSPSERFPDLGKPVFFVCGSTFCSRPLSSQKELDDALPEFVRVASSTPAE